MTLQAFQKGLCELIASPDLCLAVRAGDREFLTRYDLSRRERDRLLDIAGQRGMSTNCTLYRSNRITPIYTLLHYTCKLLGEDLQRELEEYWAGYELLNLEFRLEMERFSQFLRGRMSRGAITDPYLEEVLDFEVAVNELRFAPRRANLGLDPLVRVVRFAHDPGEVLGALARGERPLNLASRETFVMLSIGDQGLRAMEVEREAGRSLWRIQMDRSEP